MKLVIIGNSGSGKSTLAKALVSRYELSYLDLDTLAWNNTTPPTRKLVSDSLVEIMSFTAAHPNSWVIEGCYSDLASALFCEGSSSTNDAEITLVFMDLCAKDCIENAKIRPWEPHKYESKAAQDENLAMLIEWIDNYDKRSDSLSRQAHDTLFNEYSGAKVRITERLPVERIIELVTSR